MGSIDNNGIYVYDELDQPAPLHTLLNMGQAAVSSAIADIYQHAMIMPVSHNAARDSYEAAMRAAGKPPTPATPLYVETTVNGFIQRNRGNGWERLIDTRLHMTSLGSSGGSWDRDNTVARKNGWAILNLRQKRVGPFWTGTAELTETAGRIPADYRPPFTVWGIANVYLRNDGQVSLSVTPQGAIIAHSLTIGTGNWITANITWPLDDTTSVT